MLVFRYLLDGTFSTKDWYFGYLFITSLSWLQQLHKKCNVEKIIRIDRPIFNPLKWRKNLGNWSIGFPDTFHVVLYEGTAGSPCSKNWNGKNTALHCVPLFVEKQGKFITEWFICTWSFQGFIFYKKIKDLLPNTKGRGNKFHSVVLNKAKRMHFFIK